MIFYLDFEPDNRRDEEQKNWIQDLYNPDCNSFLFPSEALFSKAEHYQNTSDALSGRGDLWDMAFQQFQSSPLFGNGFGSFVQLSKTDLPSAHNSYLQKLSELGIIGTIVFFAPFFQAFANSLKFALNRKGNVTDKKLFLALLLVQVYFFIGSLSEGIFETPILFVLLFTVQLISLREIDKNQRIILNK